MYITQSYKYEYNGIVYVSSEVLEGATVLETMDILNAEDGFNLIRKSDNENVGSSVWLHDGDTQDNYDEIPEPQDDEQSING